MIEGVKITKLKQIHDERGKVITMMRNDSDIFDKFGEIYFSCSYPGVVKAWHMHHKMTLNYAVLAGEIKFVLYDSRKSSSTFGKLEQYIMSQENYFLITVPPLIWNGFKCIGLNQAIVANCSDIPHESSEIVRKNPDDSEIPYEWNIIHR